MFVGDLTMFGLNTEMDGRLLSAPI